MIGIQGIGDVGYEYGDDGDGNCVGGADDYVDVGDADGVVYVLLTDVHDVLFRMNVCGNVFRAYSYSKCHLEPYVGQIDPTQDLSHPL